MERRSELSVSYSSVVWKAEAISLEHSEQRVWERGEHLCPKSEPRRAQAGTPGACGKTSKPGRTWGVGGVGYITPFL